MATLRFNFGLREVKQLVVELVATIIFIFVVLGSCVHWNHRTDTGSVILGGLSCGFTLSAVIYAFGPISGCHINPAVTIGFIIPRRISLWMGGAYILIHFIGATIGAGALYAIQFESCSPREHRSVFAVTELNPMLKPWQGFIIEMTLTFIFILVILLITDKKCEEFSHGTVPIGIGFMLIGIEFGFVGSTGASVNPARSFGPALICMHFKDLWVYIVGPIIGSILAGLAYVALTFEPSVKTTAEPEGGMGDINSDTNAAYASSEVDHASYNAIAIDDEGKSKA